MLSNKIVIEDLKKILSNLTIEEKANFNDVNILVTGCAGFLGFYFMNFFAYFKSDLKIKRIIGIDNFISGKPVWLEKLIETNLVEIHDFDIVNDEIDKIPQADSVNIILHMASIASPTFYRLHPIETVDANIWGLRRLLDFYLNKNIKKFLFFSSSEIYGDPSPDQIPTKEDYRGNVSCVGPRACYDESKRFGETLCYLYNLKHNFPITIVRPFNSFGPGMKLNDKRVPADFALAVLENRDIVMLSDGTPTRTFCYISDSITGYLKVLLANQFEAYNIGIDKPEITIKELASIYKNHAKEMFSNDIKLIFKESEDKDYLTDNPNRRCPDITKARRELGYNPQISVEEGVARFLEFLIIEKNRGMKW